MTWLVLVGVLALFVALPFVLLRAPWMQDGAAARSRERGKSPGVRAVGTGMADFTLYSTGWCGFCRRLKTQLDAEGIGYDEIDIESDAAAARFVESVNNGNQVVPTLKFADGSTATNPSLAQVQSKLAA